MTRWCYLSYTYVREGANTDDLAMWSILFMIMNKKKVFERGFATVHRFLHIIVIIYSTSFLNLVTWFYIHDFFIIHWHWSTQWRCRFIGIKKNVIRFYLCWWRTIVDAMIDLASNRQGEKKKREKCNKQHIQSVKLFAITLLMHRQTEQEREKEAEWIQNRLFAQLMRVCIES